MLVENNKKAVDLQTDRQPCRPSLKDGGAETSKEPIPTVLARRWSA